MRYGNAYACIFLASINLMVMIMNQDSGHMVNVSIFLAAGMVCKSISDIKS